MLPTQPPTRSSATFSISSKCPAPPSFATSATSSSASTSASLPAASPLAQIPLKTLYSTAFVTEAIQAIGFKDSPAEFTRIWCDIFAPNTALITTLERLADTHPLFLLSNTSGLHKDFLFAEFPVFRLFTGGLYSFSARTSKPGSKIFTLAIEQLGLDPAQTFYIDDLLPNIETAAQLGFITHHYDMTQHAKLESALTAWMNQTL
jgi:FMN phosphatase YigB (HAD superfamily)